MLDKIDWLKIMNQRDDKSSSDCNKPLMDGAGSAPDVIGLGEFLAVCMEYKWVVIAATLAAIVLGVAYALLAAPVYRADGLVQIEEKTNGISALKDLQPLLGDSTTVSAELEILSSRMILGKVIEKLKLDVDVRPRTFPIIGKVVARNYDGDDLNGGVAGLDSYAWGGEVIKLDFISVPKVAEDKKLEIVVKEGGRFELIDPDDNVAVIGNLGMRASKDGYTVYISKMVARPGQRFYVVKLSAEAAITKLRENFNVKERGKKSGILDVSLIGPDRYKISEVLDEILNTYVRKNVERKSEEAESTLRFLEEQLPSLKKDMGAAEAAYNSYRQSRGSLDLSIETQSVLQSLVEVDNQIVALRQERDEIRQNFTAEHPRVVAIDQRIDRLKERRKQFDQEISKLPDTQQKVLRLARDVEVTTTLYTNLVNTAQELKVSKAGTVGDVRIIDRAATAADPVGLKLPAIIVISAIAGLIFSGLAIAGMRSLRVVIEDPEVIESKIGIPVYATIPHSIEEDVNINKAKRSRTEAELLAVHSPDDEAIESLRSLRTALHFAMMDATANSILVTGSSPGLGKSFISKNFGAVLANSGQRVVIVDADMRRGHINKEFGLRRDVGVSEYVVGSASEFSVVKSTSVPNLWVVTTGQIPPNPSELLMHDRFKELLEMLCKQFDVVLVDAPPILAVSDAAIIGRYTGATLMVARAGRHPVAELQQAVKRLHQSGVKVKGFVFNDFNVERQRYRYGYQGYVYKYSYRSDRV